MPVPINAGVEGDVIERARQLLKVWAIWLQQGGYAGCRGYPGSSAFVHAGEGDSSYQHDIANDDAEQVERAMCVLKRFNECAFYALFAEYVLELSNRESAEWMTEHGRRRNMTRVTVTRFRDLRERGEYFIAGRLGG